MAPPPVNPTVRLKVSLKTAISKLKFVQDKKTALAKQQRRQLADLLKSGKESSATIRVENIIRDDIYVELLEYIELYCELLLARITLIMDHARTTCEPSLVEAVSSLIYAAPHTELKEITVIREILIHKYGVEFGKAAADNESGSVPSKIVSRCQFEPPSETLVRLYLSEIARAYKAPYSHLVEEEEAEEIDAKQDPPAGSDEDDDEPSGGVAEKVLEAPIGAEEPVKSAPKKAQDEFDALKARFAALKK
ncbi:vacuolar protein sorting-associated protein Ist1p [[Candida] railenensis]|uniref:Vacuolar protein sorting-associated protein Ist1p n=1 Tax=[Candida] railenensis TaxID=45579 RepID=A0A9P0W089_9ASCO|nr:vacuolar protein sorting-associated protein Ist1p [[Candida] railenensis]